MSGFGVRGVRIGRFRTEQRWREVEAPEKLWSIDIAPVLRALEPQFSPCFISRWQAVRASVLRTQFNRSQTL